MNSAEGMTETNLEVKVKQINEFLVRFSHIIPAAALGVCASVAAISFIMRYLTL